MIIVYCVNDADILKDEIKDVLRDEFVTDKYNMGVLCTNLDCKKFKVTILVEEVLE